MPVNGQEKIWELNYIAQVLPSISVRPGVESVINPSGEGTIPNAFAITLTTVVNL